MWRWIHQAFQLRCPLNSPILFDKISSFVVCLTGGICVRLTVDGNGSVADFRQVSELVFPSCDTQLVRSPKLVSCPRNQKTTPCQTLERLPHGRLFAFHHPWKHCGSKRARSPAQSSAYMIRSCASRDTEIWSKQEIGHLSQANQFLMRGAGQIEIDLVIL